MAFNNIIVQDTLFGLVGWDQPLNPSYAILEPRNLESRSGIKINDNPYCTIRGLKETQNYIDISDIDFNNYIENVQKSSISDVCNSIFNESDYIDRQVLYKHPIYKAKTENLPNGFVGYRIKVSNQKNQAFEITRLFLDFDRPNGDETIKILLFSSEKIEPVFEQEILIDSDRVELPLNWKVDNTGSIYKGEYYLGIITSTLTVRPYSRDLNNGNILSCVTGLDIEPVKVDNHTTETLFDIQDVDGLSTYSGINVDITVYDDYTDLIVNNQTLFSRAIYLSTCIKIMSAYLASLRSNRDQRNLDSKILLITQKIEGQKNENHQKVTGYRDMLMSQINQVRKEIKKLQDGYFANGIYIDTLS